MLFQPLAPSFRLSPVLPLLPLVPCSVTSALFRGSCSPDWSYLKLYSLGSKSLFLCLSWTSRTVPVGAVKVSGLSRGKEGTKETVSLLLLLLPSPPGGPGLSVSLGLLVVHVYLTL
jgi:hypothetical protein